MKHPVIDCDELNGDATITLSQLEKLLPKLKQEYGANAELSFDGGYNNVTVRIRPSKRLSRKKEAEVGGKRLSQTLLGLCS